MNLYLVKMPRLGVTMKKGTVMEWHYNEGDKVEKGDILLTIESEKSSMDIEAQQSGYVKKIIVNEGEEKDINSILAVLGEKHEEINYNEILNENNNVNTKAENKEIDKKKTNETSINENKELKDIKISPRVRNLAKELNVDLTGIVGSGPGGLIKEEDVREVYESKKTNKDDSEQNIEKVIDLNATQKTMAETMHKSWSNIPQFTQNIKVDATNLQKIKNKNDNLTINDIIIKAVVEAVKARKIVNSSFEDNKVLIYEDINVSVAVATEKGLVVPVIKKAQEMSALEISNAIKDLVKKAKNNNLSLNDLQGGTITVSNLGYYGIDSGNPIINYPQSTIVFAGTISDHAFIDEENNIKQKPIMKLSIAYDHRFIDGVKASEFSAELKKQLETIKI